MIDFPILLVSQRVDPEGDITGLVHQYDYDDDIGTFVYVCTISPAADDDDETTEITNFGMSLALLNSTLAIGETKPNT